MKSYLDLEKVDVNTFKSRQLLPRLTTSHRVYGGQVIGQALVAASETVPTAFHPHSLHCYFIKPGDKNNPISYQVDPVRDGRSFYTRFVKGIQNNEVIFTGQMSFHKEEPDSIVHQHTMPKVPPPEECKNADDLLRSIIKRKDINDDQKKRLIEMLDQLPTTFEMRPTDVEAFLKTKSSKPYFCLWIKSKEPIGEDMRLHHCTASFISDSTMIATALLPHVKAGFHMGMVLSLDHSMWFHRYIYSVDEWMLYETESTVAAASRAFIHGRLWTRDGKLVISTAQEGLFRFKK